MDSARALAVPAGFSLSQTCGPAAWVGDRSPRHAWVQNSLRDVKWEDDRIVWRRVWQVEPSLLRITGSANPILDMEWARAVLGTEIHLPEYWEPVIAEIAATFSGLHPHCDGSVFEGVVTAIVGQSISVAAAAVTQAKLARAFSAGIELDGRTWHPLPTAAHLADASLDLIRASGVTWKRAEGIQNAAREAIVGNLPDEQFAREHPEETVRELTKLPMIGRWTAESTVLWGIGAPNAHPTGDIALLRAARQAYDRPDMTLKDLDVLAESWRPGRGLAARLLWTNLFGPAPTTPVAPSGD